MYYIKIFYFYYQDTFNSPIDAPILDDNGKRKMFRTINNAKQYLEKIGITRNIKGQQYTSEGIYYLEHGEYSRPTYKIRKERVNK